MKDRCSGCVNRDIIIKHRNEQQRQLQTALKQSEQEKTKLIKVCHEQELEIQALKKSLENVANAFSEIS
jgi:SMC interacting uncharacterized protein involved in chromosome segregation